MADTLEQLIMALAQADSAVAGSDPYASPQAAVDSIRWNPNEYGMGENAVASGLKGLLSGLFGAAGTDYKTRAAKEYEGALMSALGGKTIANNVLPAELFSKAQKQADLLKLMKLGKADDRAADMKDYEEKLKLQLQYSPQSAKDTPESKQARKEAQTAANLKQTFQFVDDKFKRAGEISTLSTLIPGGGENQELDRIKAALITQVDKLIGRETNDMVKRDLAGFAPDWNDSAKTLEKKRADLKAYLTTLADAPLSKVTKPAPDIGTFIAEAKARGLSKEQARAAWEAQSGG